MAGRATNPVIEDNTINTSPLECHDDADCINTIGSYKCRCRVGFQDSADRILNGVTGVSDEIREERIGETVTKFSTGVDCVDIDECSTKQHRCHFYAACINTHGSYTCECINGYVDNDLANPNVEYSLPGIDCVV